METDNSTAEGRMATTLSMMHKSINDTADRLEKRDDELMSKDIKTLFKARFQNMGDFMFNSYFNDLITDLERRESIIKSRCSNEL